jgi:hypothetical protein
MSNERDVDYHPVQQRAGSLGYLSATCTFRAIRVFCSDGARDVPLPGRVLRQEYASRFQRDLTASRHEPGQQITHTAIGTRHC